MMPIAQRLVCALVAAVALSTPGVAIAQSMLSGSALDPGVTRTHVDRASRVFALTEEQSGLLDAAYGEYVEDVGSLAERMRQVRSRAIEEFQSTRDGRIWRDLLEVGERFDAQRRRLDERLLGELRLLLSREQESRWRDFQRDRRRMIGLASGGLVNGDGVDLIELAERAGADTLDDEAVYAGVLREYAVAMDVAVRDLEDKGRELDRRAVEVLAEMEASSAEAAFEQFQPILDERLKLAVAVRDVNQSFAPRIERALGGELGGVFGTMFREGVYPKVYRESTAERMARAVLERAGDDDPVRARVDEIMAGYARERAALDAAWTEAIDAAEAASTVGGLIAGMSEESAAERAAWRERRRLDARVAAALRELAGGALPAPAEEAGAAGEGGADRTRASNVDA